jgi:hypothetical protein
MTITTTTMGHAQRRVNSTHVCLLISDLEAVLKNALLVLMLKTVHTGAYNLSEG